MPFWKQVLSAMMLLVLVAVPISAQEQSIDAKSAHTSAVKGKAVSTKGVTKKKAKSAKRLTIDDQRWSQSDGGLSVKSLVDPPSRNAQQEFNWNGIYGGIHMGGAAAVVSH